MKLPRLIIAGTHSGVGKTTLTLGIILALRKKGINVRAFKAGPDYIDPTYHAEASGEPCGNLDTRLVSKDSVLELFRRRAEGADISIIEGVMGLYDGLKDGDEGSTAHLAKILDCPVVLIQDARSMSRSAGAVALGYKEFDKKIDIAGIILNNIGSANHYKYVKSAIENKAGIPVLGYLPKNSNLKISERHLGLVSAEEKRLDPVLRKKLSRLIEKNINLSRLLEIGRKVRPLPRFQDRIFQEASSKDRVTIAIAKDAAFNFYYQDNLDILSHLGSDIVTFSPLKDKKLPRGVNGLYIGGGFPELFASKLSKNKALLKSIRKAAADGMPIYAECGGLMYLTEAIIDFEKRRFAMAGVFKCIISMGKKLKQLGYVDLRVVKDNILSARGGKNRAHLFHWSHLTSIPEGASFAYKIVKDGNIIYDGLIKRNVLAGYAHLHFASDLKFAENFINSCRKFKVSHG